jgi:hypothetical protein
LPFAAHAQAVGHVLEDRLGKRVGLLEHHRDAHAHLDRVDVVRQQVGVVRMQDDLAVVAVARIEVVHPVEAAEQRRLSATGRADQRRDLVLVDGHLDALERLELAVVEVEVARLRLQRRQGHVDGAGTIAAGFRCRASRHGGAGLRFHGVTT